MMQKTWKITETLANGYSSESTRRELSNEYQHDRVLMIFTNICIFVLWKKVASALEGLTGNRRHLSFPITWSIVGLFKIWLLLYCYVENYGKHIQRRKDILLHEFIILLPIMNCKVVIPIVMFVPSSVATISLSPANMYKHLPFLSWVQSWSVVFGRSSIIINNQSYRLPLWFWLINYKSDNRW